MTRFTEDDAAAANADAGMDDHGQALSAVEQALDEAEALARRLRIASDGRIDLQPVLRNSVSPTMPPLPVNWAAAKTEARVTQDTPK